MCWIRKLLKIRRLSLKPSSFGTELKKGITNKPLRRIQRQSKYKENIEKFSYQL